MKIILIPFIALAVLCSGCYTIIAGDNVVYQEISGDPYPYPCPYPPPPPPPPQPQPVLFYTPPPAAETGNTIRTSGNLRAGDHHGTETERNRSNSERGGRGQ